MSKTGKNYQKYRKMAKLSKNQQKIVKNIEKP